MRRHVLAAGAALCVLTAQSPAPAPSSLPEIGRTHSKGFCTTVRDNVAPSVLGLMKTDDLIGASHRAMAKMAYDQAHASAEEQGIDRVYAGRVVIAMAHNLGVIKKMLADEKRFPKKPASDDDRFALQLKAQLLAAADRQNEALDHVNGILETTAMGNMRNDISNQMSSSVGAPNAPKSSALGVGDQFLDASSVPGSGPGGMFQNRGPGSSAVKGSTVWDKLVADIEIQQVRIAVAEQRLTPTVVAAAAACRTGDAAPSPAP